LSRQVIHDLVLPIVLRRLDKMGAGIPTYAVPHDEDLEDYLDQQLSVILGVCGSARHCEDLEKKIREAMQRDPKGFEMLIQQLLERYINLKTKLLQGLRTRKLQGPPDKYEEIRRRAREVWRIA